MNVKRLRSPLAAVVSTMVSTNGDLVELVQVELTVPDTFGILETCFLKILILTR